MKNYLIVVISCILFTACSVQLTFENIKAAAVYCGESGIHKIDKKIENTAIIVTCKDSREIRLDAISQGLLNGTQK